MVKEALAGLLESAHRENRLTKLIGQLYSLGIGVAKERERRKSGMKKRPTEARPLPCITWESTTTTALNPNQTHLKHSNGFKKAAELGFAKAMYELGGCYVTGIGVDQSDENAFRWYSKGAEQGSVEAMNELAKLYVNGIGVEQSYPMAVTWFRRAADLGSAEAMVLLVELH